MNDRKAMTLIELVVVIGIIAMLVALVVAAVQRTRQTAARLQSQNNMRQMVVAMHTFGSAHHGRLRLPASSEGGVFTPHVWLLPFMARPQPKFTLLEPGYADVEFFRIPEFLNPADPTGAFDPDLEKTTVKDVICSFAANACVFTGRPAMHMVPDGTSSTIAFSEHYSRCKDHVFTYNIAGYTGPYGIRRATFADKEQHDVHPIAKNGITVSSAPGVTFQVAPSPKDADGFMLNTPHPSGLLAAMLDGSVRTYAPGVSERVFWSAVTPNSGEAVSE